MDGRAKPGHDGGGQSMRELKRLLFRGSLDGIGGISGLATGRPRPRAPKRHWLRHPARYTLSAGAPAGAHNSQRQGPANDEPSLATGGAIDWFCCLGGELRPWIIHWHGPNDRPRPGICNHLHDIWRQARGGDGAEGDRDGDLHHDGQRPRHWFGAGIVTFGSTVFTFNETDATDIGSISDPLAPVLGISSRFTMSCKLRTLPGCPLRVYFRRIAAPNAFC